MRIPKWLAVFCVVVLGGVGSLLAQRSDTDLQAKARAALDAAMDQPTNAPAAPAPVAPVAPIAPPPKPVPPAKPAPPVAVAPPAVVAPPPEQPAPAPVAAATPANWSAPAPAYPAVNPDAQAKALEALRAKIAQLDGESQATAPPQKVEPIVATTPPSAPVQPQPVTPPPAMAVQTPPAPAPASSAPQTIFPITTPSASASVVTTPAPPAESPAALGISADKEQRLYQLLQDYKADKITPYEYHTQRAKILAGP
jgi:hypothetical protein